MLSWRTIRGLVESKSLIAVEIVFVAVPAISIILTWLQPALGIGHLSPWLKCAYFASLMLIVASILHRAFCPKVIRKYPTEIERIETEREAYLNSNPSYRLEVTLTQLSTTEKDHEVLVALSARRDVALGADRAALDQQIQEIVEPRWPDTVQRYLARTYEEADGSLAP